MLVARFRPLQQLLEIVVADAEYNGKPDGTPKRIPAAYPIPEFEHVLRIDTELAYRFGVGRERHEMLGHGFRGSTAVEQPLPCSMRIGHGFLRGERLGSNEEQGSCRVYFFKRFCDMRTVYVGDEMDIQMVLVGLQRLRNHHWPQIGAADTDIDDIGDGLAGMAFPVATDDAVGK